MVLDNIYIKLSNILSVAPSTTKENLNAPMPHLLKRLCKLGHIITEAIFVALLWKDLAYKSVSKVVTKSFMRLTPALFKILFIFCYLLLYSSIFTDCIFLKKDFQIIVRKARSLPWEWQTLD